MVFMPSSLTVQDPCPSFLASCSPASLCSSSSLRSCHLLHLILSAGVVHSLSCVRLFVTPCTAARQASLSITISWTLLKLMSIESVMPSHRLTLCHPLLLPPSTFPSIRIFSSELALHLRWPEDWSFSFNIRPSSEHSGLISFRMDCFDPT